MKPESPPISFPLASILVINWNGKAYIETCLRSCLRLCYPNREIIVLDNDSSDGSPEIVESQFPEVRLIRTGQNLGFARASNVGIREAKGEYIAILCSDVSVDPMWLLHLVQGMADPGRSGKSQLGIAGGVVYNCRPEEAIWGGGGKVDLATGSFWHPDAFGNSVQCTKDVDFIPGGVMLVRKELFEKIGLLDEGYFLYAEDVDLCMRAVRAGYQILVEPRAKSVHMTSTGGKTAFRAYYLNSCSRIRLYLKLLPLRYMLSAIFFQVSVRPFFEILCFRQHPKCFLLNILALKVNLLKLRETFVARSKTQAFGESRARSRVKELLAVALNRLSTRTRYRW